MSDDTATEIDHEVMKLLHLQLKFLWEIQQVEMDKVEYLIRKETITGKEFMKILHWVNGDWIFRKIWMTWYYRRKEVSNKRDITIARKRPT